MVKKWYCDFCNKEIEEEKRNTLNLADNTTNHHYDLCSKCAETLQLFLQNTMNKKKLDLPNITDHIAKYK